MNMPKRASRHQASRSSRVFIDSRHQATSGLSLDGRSKFSGAGEFVSAASVCTGKQFSNATTEHNSRRLRREDKCIILQHAPQRGAAFGTLVKMISMSEI